MLVLVFCLSWVFRGLLDSLGWQSVPFAMRSSGRTRGACSKWGQKRKAGDDTLGLRTASPGAGIGVPDMACKVVCTMTIIYKY